MKYIRFQSMGILLFPDHVSHDAMARRFDDTPMSAGFVEADEINRPYCWGRSGSLDLDSGATDTRHLRKMLGYEVD